MHVYCTWGRTDRCCRKYRQARTHAHARPCRADRCHAMPCQRRRQRHHRHRAVVDLTGSDWTAGGQVQVQVQVLPRPGSAGALLPAAAREIIAVSPALHCTAQRVSDGWRRVPRRASILEYPRGRHLQAYVPPISRSHARPRTCTGATRIHAESPRSPARTRNPNRTRTKTSLL